MNLKNENTITLDNYIDEALYKKKYGYYFNKNPFGKDGDYITAPNISILFSEMIAVWIIAFWENLSCPKKFNLVELGAGNGAMMQQMISTFKKFPKFNIACNISILEKSDFLKKIQKHKLKNNNIRWLKKIDGIKNYPTIFIANEFFDALPIKQFIKKKNKWYEKNIKFNEKNKPEFMNILINMKKYEKTIGINISKNQKFIEFSPNTMHYLKKISKKIKLNDGGLLIIDYGYLNKKFQNTLQALTNHKFSGILDNFGNSDITYCINFNLIKDICKKFNLTNFNMINQRNFLLNLGIMERAEILSKKLPFTKKADMYYRVERLIGKKLMGELFKVLFVTTKNIKYKIGF